LGCNVILDIGRLCNRAQRGRRDADTAARVFCDKEPRFAATVAMFAVTHLLAGGGYDPSV
jgi:hypothetical protein